MGIEVQIIMFIASTIFQQQQHAAMKAKMEREADKRKGFMIPTRGEAAHLPVIYGKQAVSGIETKHKTASSFSSFSTNSDERFSENFATSGQSGSKNEFLFVQSALCQGDIQAVKGLYINDQPYDKEKAKFNHRFEIHTSGGTADAMATANGFPSTNKFTNCAYVTSAYKLNRDEQQYSGIPTPLYLVKGRKVKNVNSSGNLSSSRSYSNSPPLVLLDYLMDSNYGLGLSESEIDLDSFYRARVIADTIVTTRRVGGQVNDVDPILDFDNFASFPTEGEEGYIYKATNNNTFYKWDTSLNPDAYVTTSVVRRSIPLYECNITLDTEAKIRDNIERILNTMGLAELIWTSEGKYKLMLDYPQNQNELDALVDSDHNFTEDNIIRDEISINYASASERLNQVTATFINEHEDFKQDSVTWPETNSSAYSTYLSEDNNQSLKTSVNLDGITDPYHATAKAEQMVRQSREMRTLKIRLDKTALSVEPGDFIKVTSDLADINGDIFRVTKTEVSQDLTVSVEGYLFNINMLAWNINDDIAYAERPTFDFELEPITNLTTFMGFYVNNDGTIVNYMDVSWTHAGSYSYEIQYKKSSEGASSYRSITTRLQNYRILDIEPSVQYDVRVRAISSLGTPSGFEDTTATNAGKTTPPARPSGLSATGLFKAIEVNWTNPADKDFRTTQVWESSNNNISNASMIATTAGSSFTRGNLDISQTRYYWVRSEDTSGNLSSFRGPANATTTFIDDDAFETGIRDLFEGQGLYAIEDVASLPSTGVTGQQVFNRADGKLYRWNGTAWELVIASVEAADIDGILTNAQIDALAASKITGQLTNAQLADIAAAKVTGQLTNTQLADISAAKVTGQLTNAQLADIAAAKITGQLTNAQLDDIAAAKITGQLVDSQLAAISSNKISGQLTNNQIADVAAAKLTGEITETQIADDAITTAKINAGAINADKIAANTITASEIAANAITASEIAANAVTANAIAANAVTANEIAANAVTAGAIAANAVTASEIAANAVTASEIAANAVTASEIAAGAVIAAKIAADAITADKIAANAVEAASIKAGAVIAAKIAADAITADKIATNAVEAGSIKAGAVIAAKIAADAITADKIAANAVEAASIKAGAVVAGKIAANAVTAGTIAADAVTANKIAANAVTADSIAANTITGNKIAANTITSGLVATSGLITNSAQINNGLITNAKIANAAITTAKIGDGEITNAKIGNTIQSTNYSSGSSGWKINKNGSAEFNGVVISRQLQVDSGTLNIGTTPTLVIPVMSILGIFYVESTNVPMSSWSGAKKTYLANAGLSGTVVSTGSAPPDVFWGWRVIVLPLTRWSGSQSLRLRLELWGKNVSQVTNLKANWKIYEVT
jgi:hypothetical protein